MLLRFLLLTSAMTVWIPPFGYPLEVTGPYAQPATPYASGHRGIDIPVTAGAVVRAPESGTVSFSGRVVDRSVVSVRVDERTVYSMEPVVGDVRAGDRVAADDPLGTVSPGGHCADVCLHLGVRVDDEYVNPKRFFAGAPVLLPLGRSG